jgi:hypothetical protein
LERQTVKPDAFAFVYSESADGTLDLLERKQQEAEVYIEFAAEPFIPRGRRNEDRALAFTQLAKHRNTLLRHALRMDADVFFSLDTDVFLTDPTSIEQLLDALHYLPVASPLTYLHKLGPESRCYNAGFWRTYDRSETRAWERATFEQVEHENGGVLEVDIPMAAVMMPRWVAEDCAYAYHETGEDAGFAQSLDFHGFKTAWLTGLYAPHVMEPEMLGTMGMVE